MKRLSFVSGFVYQDINSKNNHSFGFYTGLTTDRTITLDEAKEIYQKVSEKVITDNQIIYSINIDLSTYNNYADNGIPEAPSEENPYARDGLEKHAVYYPAENLLRIWEAGEPIYENDNGLVCEDLAALADCLL